METKMQGAVRELLERISDGQELIDEGGYPVEEAWRMVRLQAERVKSATPHRCQMEGCVRIATWGNPPVWCDECRADLMQGAEG